MTSLLSALMKKDGKNIDQTVADSILVGSQGIASVYLQAILNTRTPELRAIFLTHLEEILNGHAALAELAVKYGWSKHYDSPENQLLDAYNKASAITTQIHSAN